MTVPPRASRNAFTNGNSGGDSAWRRFQGASWEGVEKALF